MSHANAESLSAYLDQALDAAEAASLERHLADCPECQSRLFGLKSAVAGLRRLERVAPPPALELAVARRIALAGEEKGLLARLEDGLDATSRQAPLFALFAVVVGLAVMAYLLAGAIERGRRGSISVVFDDAPIPGAVHVAGGHRLVYGDGCWVEEGVDPRAVVRRVEAGSADWDALVAADPRLAELPLPAALRLAEEDVVLERTGEPCRGGPR